LVPEIVILCAADPTTRNDGEIPVIVGKGFEPMALTVKLLDTGVAAA